MGQGAQAEDVIGITHHDKWVGVISTAREGALPFAFV